MENNSHSFAEVISSNLTTITAQCWKWNKMPIFGSLITAKINNLTIFGIIYNIQTESSDPVRQPIAYKKTHEALIKEQPQIFEFLQTTFQAIIVGYKKNNSMIYHLPSSPPTLHTFISEANTQENHLFFQNNHYLHLLAQKAHEMPNFQELLFAILKHIKQQQLLSQEHLHLYLQTISIILKNDYHTLKTFMARTETLLSLL